MFTFITVPVYIQYSILVRIDFSGHIHHPWLWSKDSLRVSFHRFWKKGFLDHRLISLYTVEEEERVILKKKVRVLGLLWVMFFFGFSFYRKTWGCSYLIPQSGSYLLEHQPLNSYLCHVAWAEEHPSDHWIHQAHLPPGRKAEMPVYLTWWL